MVVFNQDSVTDAVPAAPPQDHLSGQEIALYNALADKEQLLAAMYLGALMAYSQLENPVRFALTGHSLRELLDKLPTYIDVPVPAKPGNLKSEVQTLADSWKNMVKRTKCLSEAGWQGDIDGHLQKFLGKTSSFIDWFATERPLRRERAATTLRTLDPMKTPMPPRIESLRVDEWYEYYGYFAGVAHHGEAVDFDNWKTRLERFLVDLLIPRTFEDHALIDELIREGEKNA